MEEVTTQFKALSDPTRRQILRLLQAGDRTAGDIAAQFEMTKPTISHHLSTLRDAGLVSSQRDGIHIVYSLETTVMQDLMRWFFDFVPEPAPEAKLAEERAGGAEDPDEP